MTTVQSAARILLLGAFAARATALEQGPILCPFRRVTGRPCPSCGLSRSWQAVAHLRFRDGFRHHPIGPASMVTALWLASDGRAPSRIERTDPRLRAALGAAWIAIWLWRLRQADQAAVETWTAG